MQNHKEGISKTCLCVLEQKPFRSCSHGQEISCYVIRNHYRVHTKRWQLV